MPKPPVVKAKELLRVLNKQGFYEHHQVGSHIQMKHPDGRRITVPFHQGNDLGRKTLRSIINDLGMTVEGLVKELRK